MLTENLVVYCIFSISLGYLWEFRGFFYLEVPFFFVFFLLFPTRLSSVFALVGSFVSFVGSFLPYRSLISSHRRASKWLGFVHNFGNVGFCKQCCVFSI